MQKKKEKFLDKVIKKNFNNELELVLEKKNFDENVKNILLTILYKLETAYKDYEQVKKNVMPKDDFLKMVIDIIKNDVDEITLVKINSPEAEILGNKTFLVDKKNKKIICYPIERKVLYCLSKINKKDKIVKDKYYTLNRTISDLLNTGNNINTVEPIRDFNGFSWSIVSKDIESIEHNLMYQTLRIIAGAEFMNKWIHNREFIIDYFEMFKTRLEEMYGRKISEDIVDNVSKISVLLEAKYNQEQVKNLIKNKKEVEKELEQIRDKEEFIKILTRDKKDLNRQIKKIDTILNDKELLQEEYKKRNEELPLDKKIFSMRVLANMMKKERESLEKKRETINKMLNPQKFIKYQNSLEEKYKYLKYIEVEDLQKEINDEILAFQHNFLQCCKVKIENTKNKEEILNLLIELRYYLNMPITQTKKVNQQNKLKQELEEIVRLIINKAVRAKVLLCISSNAETDYLVLKELFNTKIINLESISINIKNENGKLFLQMFDENIFDEKIELGDINSFDLKQFLVKLNKNVKLFIV